MPLNQYSTNLNIPVTPFANDAHPNDIYKTIIMGKFVKTHHLEVPIEDLNPELHEWFSKYNLEINLAELFSKLPNPSRTANRIHSGGNGDPDKTKINWVWGGKNSYMTWYDKVNSATPNEVGYLSSSAQITYYTDLEETDPEPVHRHQLIYPTATLVQIALPHAVENPEEPRWCLCLITRDKTTGQRLGYQETLDRLNDVVIIPD